MTKLNNRLGSGTESTLTFNPMKILENNETESKKADRESFVKLIKSGRKNSGGKKLCHENSSNKYKENEL